MRGQLRRGRDLSDQDETDPVEALGNCTNCLWGAGVSMFLPWIASVSRGRWPRAAAIANMSRKVFRSCFV